MKLVWFFVICGFAAVVCDQDNPGFFLKASKNIPRVSFVIVINLKMIDLFYLISLANGRAWRISS